MKENIKQDTPVDLFKCILICGSHLKSKTKFSSSGRLTGERIPVRRAASWRKNRIPQ